MALIGNTNEEKIWNYFKSKGLNDFGCAGLMGNIQAESGLKSTNMQNSYESKLGYNDSTYTAAVDNGTYKNFVRDGVGYGICQWTYWSRKQNLLNYAKSIGKSIGDLEMQLDFLWKELSEGYATSVLAVLKTATSVLQASNVVLLKYERPADQSAAVQNKRASYGQKYYDKYSNFNSIKNTFNDTTGGSIKMKYNKNNKPLVCMQTQSRCYKGTKRMSIKGILWHSTGANNPNIKRYVQPSDNAKDKNEMLAILGVNKNKNDWNHTDRQCGMNCWIGKLADGTVATVQTMPWDYRPWGCGSGKKGSCNSGWIQFEICEDSMNDKNYFNKIYQEACEITAYLCDMYNLDPHGYQTLNGVKVPVILCHADSYKLGLGNNHGDVYRWFKKYGKDMDDVRNDVAALMKGSGSVNTTPEIPSTPSAPSTPSVPTAPTAPSTPVAFTPYLIKVTADALNIRKGAGTNYGIKGTIKNKGIYTIVEEATGKGAKKWGLLKSYKKNRNGWIALDYTKRV